MGHSARSGVPCECQSARVPQCECLVRMPQCECQSASGHSQRLRHGRNCRPSEQTFLGARGVPPAMRSVAAARSAAVIHS